MDKIESFFVFEACEKYVRPMLTCSKIVTMVTIENSWYFHLHIIWDIRLFSFEKTAKAFKVFFDE